MAVALKYDASFVNKGSCMAKREKRKKTGHGTQGTSVEISIPEFRELYQNLLGYEGENLYQEVLIPWQDKADQVMRHLQKYGDVDAKDWSQPRQNISNDLCALYALSRVSDFLLLPFQTGSYDIKRPPRISSQERSEYFIRLGMEPIKQATFHPFFHEIVEVVQSPEPSEPISLVDIIWPGFMLGNMMFCRAGVKVCGGTSYINKEIAEKSTLYFTYRRRNRPTSDLSMGWGSNSQWGTTFRRDYQDDETYYYNVDGSNDILFPTNKDDFLIPQQESLTQTERIELLVNRCFVLTDKPDVNLWPYHDRYTEPKPLECRKKSKNRCVSKKH